MTLFTDQMGNSVELSGVPQRIVSLVPSQTELLFYLGLDKEVAGITKFCVHPESMFRTKPRVGGTKKLDFEKIKALNPDLVIGNKEENERVQVEALQKLYPVWMSDIRNLEEALQMIGQVGELTGKAKEGQELIAKIQAGFGDLAKQAKQSFSCAYLIWKGPYMAAGSGTFIDNMLKCCGFQNCFGEERYPEISEEKLRDSAPDLLLLSSEPYPFRQKHLEELAAMLPNTRIMLVDGEMFSWYGSRLLEAPKYFKSLLNGL